MDLSDRLNGFVKLDVLVPANTVGFFPLNIDPQILSLGTHWSGGLVAIPGTGYVQVGPEPGCLGELAVAAPWSETRLVQPGDQPW